MTVQTKRPKWILVRFEQIESQRKALGLPKSGMARALGVTNSTYHNWQRGSTVPHPTQQQQLKDALNALSNGASTGRASLSGTLRATSFPGTFPTNAGDGSEGVFVMPALHGSQVSPPLDQSVQGISQITSAYILAHAQSESGAPSAGSIYDFVRGLRAVFAEPVTPKAPAPKVPKTLADHGFEDLFSIDDDDDLEDDSGFPDEDEDEFDLD